MLLYYILSYDNGTLVSLAISSGCVVSFHLPSSFSLFLSLSLRFTHHFSSVYHFVSPIIFLFPNTTSSCLTDTSPFHLPLHSFFLKSSTSLGLQRSSTLFSSHQSYSESLSDHSKLLSTVQIHPTSLLLKHNSIILHRLTLHLAHQ